MNCPKCKHEDVKPIDKEKTKHYCPNCNYAWDIKNGDKEPKGKLNFDGIIPAKELLDIILKGQDVSPQYRAVLDANMVGTHFEQWYQGYKAGIMSAIVSARDYYGKDRNEQGTTSEVHRKRDSRSGEVIPGKIRASRRANDPANPRPKGEISVVKERVSGVDFTYPSHIRVPENMFIEAAELVDKMNGAAESFNYDGSNFTVKLKSN